MEEETENNNGNGSENHVLGLSDAMFRLLSTQADVVNQNQRRVWMEAMEETLRTDPASRKALTKWKGYHCPAMIGYGRLAQLFVVALLAEASDEDSSDDKEGTIFALWEGLTHGLAFATHHYCPSKRVRKWARSLAEHSALSLDPLRKLAEIEGGGKTLSLHVVPAIVLGALVEQFRSNNDKDSASTRDFDGKTNVWLTKLLSYSLQHFGTLDLARAWLAHDSRINPKVWEETILPALLVKLKSHPDKSLPTIVSWLGTAPKGVLPLSPSGEWQSVVMKQVQSNKVENREAVHALIRVWAKHAVSVVAGALSWTQALVQCKVALAPARLDLFHTVISLALITAEGEGATLESDAEVSKEFVESFTALASKEATHKATAWQALVSWFVALKSLKMDGSKHTAIIMNTLANTCLKLVDQAALILTALVRFCSSVETRRTIAVDLWRKADWSKAMQKIVESANAKKPDPPLYALYWSLLFYASKPKEEKYPAWINKVLNGASSILYANSTAINNPSVVAHCLALASDKVGPVFFTQKTPAVEAFALCITSPHQERKENNNITLLSLENVLETNGSSGGKLSARIVEEIWNQVEAVCKEREEYIAQRNATRQARESESVPTSPALTTTLPWSLIRRAAMSLVSHTAAENEKAWVLTHIGSSLRSIGRQRKAFVQLAKENLSKLEEKDGLLATRLLGLDSTSGTSHRARLSLWTTFGQITMADLEEEAEGDEAEVEISPVVVVAGKAEALLTAASEHLASKTKAALHTLCSRTDDDMMMFRSPDGVPFHVQASSGNTVEKKKRMTEDEKWEEEMKKELAAKKKSGDKRESSQPAGLSPEDQDLVAKQNSEREKIRAEFVSLQRCLDSIEYISNSDIEVGNSALPVLSQPVMTAAVADCPALDSSRVYRDQAVRVLEVMASCVYEIEEKFASSVSQALLLSSKSEAGSPETIEVVALPSPCEPAAAVVQELEDFGDTLSGGSFAFVFPILRAVLAGPRTPSGCEAALEILGRHTQLLFGDAYDSVVGSLRKDMAISVLELLKHDRAQAFQHPSASEVLVGCYKTENNDKRITTAELSPLLDGRGALAGSKNCRVGSMLALAEIASTNRKLLQQNPLAENRVWVNCFDENDEIRQEAQKTWSFITESGEGGALLSPPSALYAAPLLPLLSTDDASIATAASKAFAYAMAQHNSSLTKNMENLCKSYIEAFPTLEKPKTAATAARGASTVVPPKKKPMSTGLPKKKSAPKTPAGLGIGKPKLGTKKKASSAATKALLKPKVERTLDQDALDNQFRTAESTTSSAGEEKDSPSRVTTRLGVLRTLTATTTVSVKIQMEQATLKQLTSFLVAFGIAEINEETKTAARNTFRDIIATYGGSDEAVTFLLPQLETVLKSGVADESGLGALPAAKVPRDVAASDRRKEGAVVALGSVALHLKGPENEGKIDSTVDMLLAALKTPSEDVQASVADALAKLMKKGRTQDRIDSIVGNLLNDCLHGDSLATRRGAAYGLSAAVKGSGIGTLKKLDVVKTLEEAFESGSSNNKEGALFAIELLSSRLGLLFEPYVIVLLPSLLKSFSDGSDYVRKAAAHTASLIMSKLSAHGVKLVTPAVLSAFDDPAWRTKQASIHMLGAMSHLAPKQLAAALPKIVPKLTEAFGDTHPKVKASAQEALNEISTVIRNPEIKSISSSLLKALTDPADFTQPALESLIGTEFLHSIDAPSLALIVPILHRGLRDRGATVKRMGGLITGNICTMINDPRDFVPYIPTLLPDLQVSLLDPIPDVRGTAAKALGSLTRSLGDHILPELRPWLVQKLRDESCSSAERSGAAQGLTEVLIASGSDTVDETMKNEILPLRSHPDPSTREGVLWMLSFLPPALGQGFTPLIDVSLPALVAGLSDESESVRDVAMRAGRVLIRSHGKVHVDKILPSLEVGLQDDDYRIRVASLSLLGDLLSMIGGTSVVRGDGDTQDDIRKAEKAQAQIALTLGTETRKRVLSGLYLARSDSVQSVRQNALQVWKTVVSQTGRTLRDILPVLVARIIENLASGHQERMMVAGQCLGDVVSKLGDSVLPQIMPVLRDTLHSGDEKTKLGVCVGLNEVIKCSTKEQIVKYIDIIVKVVQDALSDDDAAVRKMAASSFQSLHTMVGTRAFDEVVPSLMVALEHDTDSFSRARALNGLVGILSVRSKELLPYIVPRLIQRPISENHAQALSGIAEVTGTSIYYHFSQIIPSILEDLSDPKVEEEERISMLREAVRSICFHVDEAGVSILISEIASKCPSDKAAMRRESCLLFQVLVTERAEKKDFYDQLPVILRELLYRLNDEDPTVLKAANAAFTALSKHVPAEELVKHIEFMRNLLASIVSDARRRKGGVGDGEFLLPGFNIPKGLDPLLPIYQRGILYGSSSIREVSAAGLGEVLNITAPKFLAGPLVVKMTGPLLRIVGDRNPSNVKVAILKTLGLILVKGGPALRAFVPQFQTTFVKALADPSRNVRIEAINALSLLMPLSTRVDPLIKELVSGSLGKNLPAEGTGAVAVQTATLQALTVVLEKGGAKAKLPASIPSALSASKELLDHPGDQGIREGAAKVMGASLALLGVEAADELLGETILVSGNDSQASVHGKLCAIRRIMASSVGKELSPMSPKLKLFVLENIQDEASEVREAALVALGAVVGRSENPGASLRETEHEFVEVMEDSRQSIDIHRAVATGLAIAIAMQDAETRVDFLGVSVLDACLKIALGGSQRVQFAFNDVLFLALDVSSGGESALEKYCSMAQFENQRSMKSLHSKVLSKIKEVTLTS